MIDKWEEEKYKQVNSRENSIFSAKKIKFVGRTSVFEKIWSFLGQTGAVRRSFGVI